MAARVGLWMNPVNGGVCVYVCLCEREGDIHTCGITGCVELLTKVGLGPHLEDLDVGSWPIVGCMEWWACHSVLAQFPWDTDAVTEVCMTGFLLETHDHTCGGRKEVGWRTVTLQCVRIKA